MTERGSGPVDGEEPGSPRTRSCVMRCRPSWSFEWSPEQIAAWLRATYPDRVTWHVCHETIYQALYHGGKGGLRRELTRRLRTGRPLRKRRRRAHQRLTRFISPALLIDHRPLIVDYITGRSNQSAIGTR
jgi:IS30 family transposase